MFMYKNNLVLSCNIVYEQNDAKALPTLPIRLEYVFVAIFFYYEMAKFNNKQWK